MFDAAQRVSIVLEYQDDERDWAAVAMLIDERGRRRRTTLARFPDRASGAQHLEAIYSVMPQVSKQARS